MIELLINLIIFAISGIFLWSYLRYAEDEKNKKK